jgi:beta-aspartyl-dipeptidase (metallo-type)
MHTGRGKKGLTDILKITDETDIPITQFRPTHVNKTMPGFDEFAQRGGYLDFTSGIRTAETAERIADALQTVNLKQITLSSDSNGSFPKWSADMKIIGMGVGKMETLFDTIRHLIKDQNVSISDAVSIITCNVADALMLNQKGRIAKDKDADLVLLDENLEITDVIARGKQVLRYSQLCVKNYYEYE